MLAGAAQLATHIFQPHVAAPPGVDIFLDLPHEITVRGFLLLKFQQKQAHDDSQRLVDQRQRGGASHKTGRQRFLDDLHGAEGDLLFREPERFLRRMFRGEFHAQELVESAARMIKILEDLDFHDIVISLKGSHVLETVEAYRLAAKRFNYPLHVGITEAGPKDIGLIRSSAGIAPILLDGIGDTIRISLSDDPIEEVRAARRLLKDLEIRTDYPTLISCPTCGRTQVNLVPLAQKILSFLEENNINKTVAVMGCIVNGPGEAKRADIGCAGGKGVWVIFKKDQILKQVDDKNIYDEITKELLKLK